jgi:hypothetical protein
MNTEQKIFYFGTDIMRAGHFMWTIHKDGKGMEYNGLKGLDKLPFNPEDLVDSSQRKGTVVWHRVDDYTICAIVGSPGDKRLGSKCVFWVKENISFIELEEKLCRLDIVKRMFSHMPFQINWDTI